MGDGFRTLISYVGVVGCECRFGWALVVDLSIANAATPARTSRHACGCRSLDRRLMRVYMRIGIWVWCGVGLVGRGLLLVYDGCGLSYTTVASDSGNARVSCGMGKPQLNVTWFTLPTSYDDCLLFRSGFVSWNSALVF